MQDPESTDPVLEQSNTGREPTKDFSQLVWSKPDHRRKRTVRVWSVGGWSPPIDSPHSVPPSMNLVDQGVDVHNDGITDISRMQNNSLNDSNGSDVGVGEGDNERQEEGRGLSYSEVVLEMFSGDQVKEVVSVLIEYIKDSWSSCSTHSPSVQSVGPW